MIMRGKLVAITAAASLAWAVPSLACSVTGDYRVPTNFELVEQADAILLGVVEDASGENANPDKARMVVRTTAVLKGGPLPERIRLFGMLAPARFAVRSNPDELEQAHPLAYIGGCIRYMFVKGSTVLFFLDRQDGKLIPLMAPFARWAEDVPSPDSRWAKAVRLYVEIAALPEPQRRAALKARREELMARSDDPDAQAIAADIARQLEGNRRWHEIMREEIERMDPSKL